ncbi:MAG TPA: isoprenylcysteine carboxylmethyltransferase family protein, partial [Spirochaetia bacterium]|nr:isoprenylcysteine carboxylmethyltransferase family protein [Spirochaetia bacterium]
TMLTLFGIGLASTNWLALIVNFIGGFATYAYRVVREERVLVRELGQPYLDYMKRTKRFIPWLF